MNLPKIPIWCIPWKARKRMAEMQALIDADRAARLALVEEVVAEKSAHKETVQQKIGVEMTVEVLKERVAKLDHAVGSLVRWIEVTHKLDERATQHGLTDILKDFPRK